MWNNDGFEVSIFISIVFFDALSMGDNPIDIKKNHKHKKYNKDKNTAVKM